MGSAHVRNIRLNVRKLYNGPIRLLVHQDFTVRCIQVESIARGRWMVPLILRHIPSLEPVLVLVALINPLLPAVVCTDSEGPLAIGESQTEPGSVEICPITSSNNTL